MNETNISQYGPNKLVQRGFCYIGSGLRRVFYSLSLPSSPASVNGSGKQNSYWNSYMTKKRIPRIFVFMFEKMETENGNRQWEQFGNQYAPPRERFILAARIAKFGPSMKPRETLRSRGNKTQCFPRGQSLSVLLYLPTQNRTIDRIHCHAIKK